MCKLSNSFTLHPLLHYQGQIRVDVCFFKSVSPGHNLDKKNFKTQKPFRSQMDSSKTYNLIHKNDHTQHKPGLKHANINIECF